jgi:flagellar biogenesis protein FliO
MRTNGVGEADAKEPGQGVAGAILERLQAGLRYGFAGITKPRGKRRMELVERLELGGRRQLMLVICDGQRYLVGAGGESVHAIAELRSSEAGAGREMQCGS